MKLAVRSAILLLATLFLAACGNRLGEVGRDLATSRDEARGSGALVGVAESAPAQNGSAGVAGTDAAGSLVVELSKPSLGQALAGYAEVSQAARVLQSAEFTSQLNPNLRYTIFVPTDAAFQANSPMLAEAALNAFDAQSMWLYLTVPQEMRAASFTNTTSLPTLHGKGLPILVVDGTVTVATANLLFTNIEFEQGVIHIINQTIFP